MSGPLPAYPPDRGCDLAPRCLECPFPQCRYDTEGERYADRSPPGPHLATRMKAQEAARLRAEEGFSIVQIAERMGRSRRTVLRDLAIARAGRGEPSVPGGHPPGTHHRG